MSTRLDAKIVGSIEYRTNISQHDVYEWVKGCLELVSGNI
jgi:hypothetical protein